MGPSTAMVLKCMGSRRTQRGADYSRPLATGATAQFARAGGEAARWVRIRQAAGATRPRLTAPIPAPSFAARAGDLDDPHRKLPAQPLTIRSRAARDRVSDRLRTRTGEASTRRGPGGACETERRGPHRAEIRRDGSARGEPRGGDAQRRRTRPRRAPRRARSLADSISEGDLEPDLPAPPEAPGGVELQRPAIGGGAVRIEPGVSARVDGGDRQLVAVQEVEHLEGQAGRVAAEHEVLAD